MKELQVGIVGLGWVAGAHIEALAAVNGARVAAVCTRRPLSAADVAAQYGVEAKVYHDYSEMIADPELDVITICTPNKFHPAQAIAAAEAGKHLYIEKPLAVNYADAKAMREVIHKTGVKACVGFECRFSKQFTMMKSLIDQGMFGDLHYGEIDYYHGIGPWYGQIEWNVRKDCGGSALLSAGCHALDALLMAMGDEVEEVTSYGSKSGAGYFADYEYDPTSVTILKFKNGKIGKTAACIDCLQPYYFHVHLVGSKGSMLDNKFYSEMIPGTIKEKWSTLETAMVDSGEVTDHPYLPQIQAFVDSIATGGVMPLTDFDTAYETHRVIYAADLSAAEGRSVRLAELD
ncbi:MAG: Gfo/Idh/MocA family oxidoreductase [Victivallales bacterium]|jgi:predicted dehydrogenase|nr:Gfo/Idh/MocA family oxidoreductase [Victivallales bacterium]MBT7165813.1 Gfo/Idh/MocA family oxidoreductase [Victivallales bacterium]MBT7298107.1 Gfo/Idh/MocA family oxidoreductase [Victivallales bacterium]